MHPALHIQELLSEIFQFIGERSETRRPTLNALVQVCKTFYEPAMNELWHTQKSLLPFILLLKGGAIQVRDIPNDEENGFDDDEMEDDDGLQEDLPASVLGKRKVKEGPVGCDDLFGGEGDGELDEGPARKMAYPGLHDAVLN